MNRPALPSHARSLLAAASFVLAFAGLCPVALADGPPGMPGAPTGGPGGPTQAGKDKKEGPAEEAPKDKEALRPIEQVPAQPAQRRRVQFFEAHGYMRLRTDFFSPHGLRPAARDPRI